MHIEHPQPFSSPIYITRPVLPDLAQVMAKLQEIWDSSWLTNNGAQHVLLEQRLVEYLKVPQLSLFNNGTIALITAIQGLRLSGEVITTPFTFPATPHVLAWNNIRPIFCDIDPQTMNLDPGRIEEMITPTTTGILAVHVYGTPCDVGAIQEIADRYGLRVVYDAAHAFGCEINGVGIGNFGDATMFSFHATKLFHSAEGGALTFRDSNLKARIDLLKNFGIKNEEEVVMPGINGKMNEIQAALGLIVLEYVAEERRQRQRVADIYRRRLREIPGIVVPSDLSGVTNSFQYFVIRINESEFGISRDELHKRCKNYNVITRKYFYPLCSEYSCYRQLPSAKAGNLEVAHKTVQEVLCLPFYGGILDLDAEKVCDIIEYVRMCQ